MNKFFLVYVLKLIFSVTKHSVESFIHNNYLTFSTKECNPVICCINKGPEYFLTLLQCPLRCHKLTLILVRHIHCNATNNNRPSWSILPDRSSPIVIPYPFSLYPYSVFYLVYLNLTIQQWLKIFNILSAVIRMNIFLQYWSWGIYFIFFVA